LEFDMGDRGPAPEPTALRVLKGGKAHKGEPQPADGEVVPPAWLTRDGALDEWHRLAPDLIAKKVLTFWDVQAFAEYCDAVATVAEAAEALADEGYVVDRPVFDRNGKKTGTRKVPSEWVQIQSRALEVSARRAARFGLTPSDRSGVSVGGGTAGDRKDPSRLLSS
jgi:P27 family predicted phage terminase small subunit